MKTAGAFNGLPRELRHKMTPIYSSYSKTQPSYCRRRAFVHDACTMDFSQCEASCRGRSADKTIPKPVKGPINSARDNDQPGPRLVISEKKGGHHERQEEKLSKVHCTRCLALRTA